MRNACQGIGGRIGRDFPMCFPVFSAWTNAVGRDRVLPTGLGWFVQNYNAETVVWQFGVMTGGYSSLILKIPAKRLTLVLLANSDGLCSPFDLSTGDVTKSLFALVFLRLFA